jgi:hypothetical protein
VPDTVFGENELWRVPIRLKVKNAALGGKVALRAVVMRIRGFFVEDVSPERGELVNLIRAELKDSRAVKRTVSIPKWMDDKVAQSGLSLSKVLQEALSEKLA